MLRRKLSAGLLRPSLPTPQIASPGRPRSRSLASAVLLSSQRNWKSETVVTLKTELKKRGLSQQGNKATLIARLESAETSSLLGPLPPFPNVNVTGTRSLSTSASVYQPPKSKKETAPTKAASEDDPSVRTTGPEVLVSSPATESRKVDPIEPEKITVAPGLPQSDVASTTSGEKLDLVFPRSQAAEEIDQVIPSTPDNYASTSAPSPEPSVSAPKVLTVASASTHLSGGPVHGVHESIDSHSLEADSTPSLKDLPSFTEALTSVIGAPGRAWSSIGFKAPEINLPKAESKGEYKYEKRNLNDEEKRGVWVLAGVVGLGLALGGGGSGKKDKKGLTQKAKELKDQATGNRTVKGDAQWEKASGAGVVGHGSRKD
ncbi:uncharacterized protein IL334_004810 [Kwoniella shivajii]|uniref:SAP domain-containing protein n=1 Tax=Kwoniella shivajii TaxID=564305 RepID=A0ABZ1D4E1_9TREE|nr:hypothetical protein IL334_004810 [Kwoniella shivajii]